MAHKFEDRIDEFDNCLVNGIHVSRYIASWINSGGDVRSRSFRDYLKGLIINDRNLTDEEVEFIMRFARGGKMEFEMIARDMLGRLKYKV